MWRLEPTAPTTALLIEATQGGYKLPERGLLGPHALFDPAVLETPKLDDAFRAQREGEWSVSVKRRDADHHHHLSLQSAGRRGLEGRSRAGASSTGATSAR